MGFYRRQRLLRLVRMAVIAMMIALQPIAAAQPSCWLRASLLGESCCCDGHANDVASRRSCCDKSRPDATRAGTAGHQACSCEHPTDPVGSPPAGGDVSHDQNRLMHMSWIVVDGLSTSNEALIEVRAHAPPGAHCWFFEMLRSGMARALAFERILRS